MFGPPSYVEDKDYVSTSVLPANRNWARKLHQTFPQYFPDARDKQAPKVLWLGCSDSRVHESDATTALPNTVFAHRNIANQFHLNDDSALSVFAYAVKVLHVRHIVVVGHEHCGGVITAMKGAELAPAEDQVEHHYTLWDSLYHIVVSDKPNDVHDKDSKDPMDAITRWLMPLEKRIKALPKPVTLETAIEENVKLQVENLAQLDGWVRSHARDRPVWVHGLVYDFETGFLRDLEITRDLGQPC